MAVSLGVIKFDSSRRAGGVPPGAADLDLALSFLLLVSQEDDEGAKYLEYETDRRKRGLLLNEFTHKGVTARCWLLQSPRSRTLLAPALANCLLRLSSNPQFLVDFGA